MAPRTTRALVIAWTCALAACGSRADDLTVDAVEASKVARQVDTQVTIRGAGFTAVVRVDLDSDDPPAIDSTMRVEIGDTAIADQSVALVDDHTIDLVIPAGLPLGAHDVRVIAPDGTSSVLPDGLVVADAAVRIETAPAGAGDAVDGAIIGVGATLPLYAVTRFTDDSTLVRDEPAGWTLTDVAGTITPASGTTTTFSGVTPGTSVVTATSDVFGADDSGNLIVVEDLPGMIPPLPSIAVMPGIGDTATLFTADATGTTDYDEPATELTYEWDWHGDGTFDDLGAMATHTYPAQGDYRVVLRVTDSDGLSAYAGFVVIVTDGADGIVVTTPLDEDDVGATPADPGGTGLSLREAIDHAATVAGKQHVLVPSGYVITLSSPLPPLDDPDGVDIVGDGATVDGGGDDCFVVLSNDNHIAGLEIRNCAIAIDIQSGGGNRVSRASIHDNMIGARVLDDDNIIGPNNELYANADAVDLDGKTIVIRNRLHDNTAHAVFTHLDADASLITGNTIYRNHRAIEFQTLSRDAVIVHNTMHDQDMPCLDTPASSNDTDMRNNIFTGTGTAAYDAFDNQFEFRDYNLYFDNAGGPCTSCSGPGPNSIEADPMYVLAEADDFRLLPGSPAVNAGLDLGLDVNADADGLFESIAPDIGAFESPY